MTGLSLNFAALFSSFPSTSRLRSFVIVPTSSFDCSLCFVEVALVLFVRAGFHTLLWVPAKLFATLRATYIDVIQWLSEVRAKLTTSIHFFPKRTKLQAFLSAASNRDDLPTLYASQVERRIP
jgi:hypothetical protein